MTDEDKIFIDNEMEKKIFHIEKDANINYERFWHFNNPCYLYYSCITSTDNTRTGITNKSS